jgi:hypothetical protein
MLLAPPRRPWCFTLERVIAEGDQDLIQICVIENGRMSMLGKAG